MASIPHTPSPCKHCGAVPLNPTQILCTGAGCNTIFAAAALDPTNAPDPDQVKFFVKVPHAVLLTYGPRIGPTALTVYLMLCRHMDKQRLCWPATSTLATETGVSRRAVGTALKVLIAHGLISRWRRYADGGKRPTSNIYRVTDLAVWADTERWPDCPG